MSSNDSTALRTLLKRAGLDAREAEVYLALLSLKVAPASAIAKDAQQQRSNTYIFLQSLIDKGLVSEVERGKVKQFVAEPPQRLLSYLDDRGRDIGKVKTLVEGAMPLLSSLTKPLTGKPRVTMHSGLAGMKQVYRDTLLHDFIGAFNVQKLHETFGKDFLETFFGKGAQLHARDLAVDNEAGRAYMREWKEEGTHQVRLLPADVRFEGDVIVFGDTIALFSYDDDKTVVRIDNQQLADTLRAWLEVLWSVSRTAEQLGM